MLLSIIVSTRNRATALQRTLDTLGRAKIPSGCKAEVMVVDNASTDDTAAVVRTAQLRNAALQYLPEPKPGLSHARNAGLARARGEILIFTDDDVFIAADWIEQLVSLLLNGGCEAVTGEIALAPHLLRPWMTPMHRLWLASSGDARPHEGKMELIGANMAFRRSVLDRVPAFDPELGAGALGAAEETLFGWQLLEAGFRIGYAPKACVVHHLDASRLRRGNWLNDARKRGRTQAYLSYHWQHADIRAPRLEGLSYSARLSLRRILQRPPPLESEGCPTWEMSYVLHAEKCRQFRLERRRPRNYSRRGLVKLTSGSDSAASSSLHPLISTP